jgi:hypothetical protein
LAEAKARQSIAASTIAEATTPAAARRLPRRPRSFSIWEYCHNPTTQTNVINATIIMAIAIHWFSSAASISFTISPMA